MFNTSKLVLFTVGVLLSSAGVADDTTQPESDIDSEQRLAMTPELHNLLAEPRYESRLRALPSAADVYVKPSARRSAAEFDFHETSVVSQVEKLRSLSLLTLVETDKTRLFLGINSDGLAGLHFKAVNRSHDEFHLDLARAPYLKSKGAYRR